MIRRYDEPKQPIMPIPVSKTYNDIDIDIEISNHAQKLNLRGCALTMYTDQISNNHHQNLTHLKIEEH